MTAAGTNLYALDGDLRQARGRIWTETGLSVILVFVGALGYLTHGLAHPYGYPPALGEPWVPMPGPWSLAGLVLVLAMGVTLAILYLRHLPSIVALVLVVAAGAQLAQGPLYAPWQVLAWGELPIAPGLRRQLLGQAAQGFLLVAGLLGLSGLHRAASLEVRTETHGSSRWGTAEDLAPLLQRISGPVVGGLEEEGGSKPKRPALDAWLRGGTRPQEALPPILTTDEPNVCLVGPPGRGKTLSSVVPTLLTWPYSAIVFDPKPELYAMTAGYLSGTLGHRVLQLDLSEVFGEGLIGINPFDLIPSDDRAVKYARVAGRTLAGAYVDDPRSKIWQESGTSFLTAAILHGLYTGRQDLPSLYEMLTSVEAKGKKTAIDLLLDDFCSTRHREGFPHPTIVHLSRSIQGAPPETKSSVYFTSLALLGVFADPLIAPHLRQSFIHPKDFQDPDQPPTTLFLSCKPSETAALSTLLTLIFELYIAHLTSGSPPSGAPPSSRLVYPSEVVGQEGVIYRPPKIRAGDRRPLMFFLDELYVFKDLSWLINSASYLRGFRIFLFAAIQNLAQVKHRVGQHDTLLPNFSTVVYTPNDLATAEEISKSIGSATVRYSDESRSRPSALGGGQRSTSEAEHRHGRALIGPDELRRLSRQHCIPLIAGLRPAYARQVRAFEDPRFRPGFELELAKPCRPEALPSPWLEASQKVTKAEADAVEQGKSREAQRSEEGIGQRRPIAEQVEEEASGKSADSGSADAEDPGSMPPRGSTEARILESQLGDKGNLF